MDVDAPVIKTNTAARPMATKWMRYALIGGLVFIIALVAWRMFAGSKDDKKIVSKAEKDLSKIMDATSADGKSASQVKGMNGKGAEQATGDQEALMALNQSKADDDTKERRKMEAENRMIDALAFQNYQRKVQGLKYDQALAAEWERRISEAQRNGQTMPSVPTGPQAQDFDELRKSRPDLYAKWVALSGDPNRSRAFAGQITPGSGLPAPAAAGGPQGLNQAMPTVTASGPAQALLGAKPVPVGIDPKTGLPVAVTSGDPDSPVYSLMDDGSPDIGHGAIPVQVQFTPPGATAPVTLIKWLKPGFLTGRIRPYDPGALKEEDEAFRRSLKDSTDVPADTSANNVAIPYRYTSNRVRATGTTDFRFQNRYVVVLPNPSGQLDPPNPPQRVAKP